MKNVYFIRHGETELNIDHKYNFPETSLNEQGLEQAQFVAGRFSRIDIDVIVASTMERATQTAKIIGKKIGKEVISSDLFREKKHPSEFTNISVEDSSISEAREEIARHYGDEDWHYSDEENYFDARSRAVDALEFLRIREEKNVVVVTHGTFLRILLAVMLYGDQVANRDFGRLAGFLVTRNTGITWCKLGGVKSTGTTWRKLGGKGVWELVTWNDHAHLG